MTAGRCEICNQLLYIDSYYGDDANFGENAHILAVGSTGPRHSDDMSPEEINRIDNLMLLCAEHHHLIDTKPDDYKTDYLLCKKRQHEERIRRLTDIKDDASCQMVTYFSNIDDVTLFSADDMLRRAAVKDKMYPKQDSSIALHEGMPTRYEATKQKIQQQAEELERQVRINFGSIKNEEAIALYALAPQPLLFKLGSLLSDQLNIHVFQCHRDSEKWTWPDDDSMVNFIAQKTKCSSDDVIALVIDLSAPIVDERITKALGDECSIYHLSIDEPNRLFVRNPSIQDAFVKAFRAIMETIKNENPECRLIHVFPAMPQSLAIRAGMDYMPKADLLMLIYEQGGAEKGFIETITIGGV